MPVPRFAWRLVVSAVAVLAVSPSPAAQFFGWGAERADLERVRSHMEVLASDAMNGRASGSRDEWIAATYVASQLRPWGLEPLGDAGTYLQRVPTPPRPARRGGGAADSGPGQTWNVIARLPGRDRTLAAQAIVLGAHLDHVGARGEGPDTIFNGADDNASGVTAVLELARILATGRRPKRTIIFAWFGSEEAGGLGARHFVDHPPVPLSAMVANLQFEMIGRPDPLVPPASLWLTGFERSTLGAALAEHGARLVADPRPDQNFFTRSDNIRFARRGVVAHTVSSFGLHREYHTAQDDLSHIDFPHMTRAIDSLIRPLRWLADTAFLPVWHPGQSPERP